MQARLFSQFLSEDLSLTLISRMATHIDEATLARLQKLTHIHLSDAEKVEMHEKLDAIVGMLDRLQEVDVTDVSALTNPVSGQVMRLGGEAEKPSSDPVAIIHNVGHRMVNNAIKIKSMIEQE